MAMKQEQLQHLFYSFIEHRQKDNVDGIAQGDISEYEDPLARIPGRDYVFPFEGVLPPLQTYASLTTAQASATTSVGHRLAQLAEQYSSGREDNNNIAFESCHLIVAPEEQIIHVYIVRSDSLINRVTKVTWKTCDKTAQSGIHYVSADGEVVFNEGETKKKIEIQILKFTDKAIDLRFKVKLSDVNGVFNSKPLTVTLKKTDNFYPDEKDVLNSLPTSMPFSVDAVRFALNGSLSARTFHLALSHLCSAEENVHVQLALAFELGRLCLHKLGGDLFMCILTDFFRMDEIDF